MSIAEFPVSNELPTPNHTPIHVQAATASWLAPLVAIAINIAVGANAEEPSARLAVGAVAGIIVLAGLLFAVWAIIGAVLKGPFSVLVPATIGLLLNGFLVFSAYTAFQVASTMAEKHRMQEMALASSDWIPTGEEWHVDRDSHFAVLLPADWEVVLKPQPGIAVAAARPLLPLEVAYRENITIGSGNIPLHTNPEIFLAKSLKELGEMTVGFLEYESGTKTSNGIGWSWIDYREIKQDVEFRVMGYMAVRHGRVYAAFFRGLPEGFQDLRSEFDQAVASIHTP